MSRALFVVPSGSFACIAQQADICCQRLPDRLAWDVAGCMYRLELAPGEAGGGIELRSTPTGRSPGACVWTPTSIPTRNASRFCRHPCRRRSTMPRTPGAQFLFAGPRHFRAWHRPNARSRNFGTDRSSSSPWRHWESQAVSSLAACPKIPQRPPLAETDRQQARTVPGATTGNALHRGRWRRCAVRRQPVGSVSTRRPDAVVQPGSCPDR